ncbi:MAG: membrane protein insertion efficiency factor YidD [Verrucomicrobiales bacterium]|nr:membrane protein insertion efficiency factor YidD [Verrucomicrobiales bacterium]
MIKKILFVLGRFCQVVFSRRAHFLFGSACGCRFESTSSQYSIDPVTINGPFRGSKQGTFRICRCHF